MKNAFNFEIKEIKDTLKDPAVKSAINEILGKIFTYIGIQADKGQRLINKTLEYASSYETLPDYEKNVHDILESEGLTTAFPQKLFERSAIMYEEIKPYLIPGSILDLGCGDGKVGELLAKDGRDVTLADVFKHQHIDETELPFHLFQQGDKVPLKNNQFDNTLTLYVYHHSDNPLDTLLEAKRVTKPGGRIIVLESVFGVTGEGLSEAQKQTAQSFINLNEEQQRLHNIFFDHFWNRVFMFTGDFKNKINVPFNFNTPAGWKKVFEENGLEQEKIVHLGIDQPTVPEYHTLHVLRVK